MISNTRVAAPRLARSLLPRFVNVAAVELAFVAVFFATSALSPFLSLYEHEWRFPVWLVTFAFGVYALALLIALLTVGALSDYIGRRPVLVISLLVGAGSMVLLMVAPSIGWVIAARIIQGLATGAATGAISARIVEVVPTRHHATGVLLATVTPPGGQALGGIITGSVVALSRQPSLMIFGTLAAILLLGAILIALGGESVTRRPGAARSLVPQVSVPRASRPVFIAAVPVLVTTWMLGAFYLGLLPSAATPVFHIDGGFITGLTLTLLNGIGVVATLSAQKLSALTRTVAGEAVVIVGGAGLVLALALSSVPLLVVGTCVAGVGYGWAFSGSFGRVLPTAAAHERSGLFSALYVVSYLALGIPAIVAGFVAGSAGVLQTAIGYVSVVMIAAILGLVAQTRRRAASHL